jgi:hypothetical protein
MNPARTSIFAVGLGGKTSCADEATETGAVPLVLRIGVAGCFIGHGAFGIITKAAWVPYFGVAGIGEPAAWQLMPWIGRIDIGIGLLALAWPCRALFLWAAGWAAWTALLRPLAGESAWEFFERAGNYGVPLAVLVATGWRGAWFARLPSIRPDPAALQRDRLAWTLRLTTATLLAGHAGCGFFLHKAGLAHLYAAAGVPHPAALVPLIGGFEFILAGLVLVFPQSALFVSVCVWKLATEALFPIAGASGWEFVERFGSYTAPLALAVLFTRRHPSNPPAALPAT